LVKSPYIVIPADIVILLSRELPVECPDHGIDDVSAGISLSDKDAIPESCIVVNANHLETP